MPTAWGEYTPNPPCFPKYPGITFGNGALRQYGAQLKRAPGKHARGTCNCGALSPHLKPAIAQREKPLTEEQ